MEGIQLLFIVLVYNSLVRTQQVQDDPDQFVVDMTQSKYQYVDATGRRHSSPLNDTGYAEICGPKNATLEFSWRPKVVSQSGEVDVRVHFVAPVSIQNGTLSGDVYIPEVRSKIFEYNFPFTCKDLHKIFTDLFPCPIKKGETFPALTFTHKLKNMPVGNFIINGEIKNENGELFICFVIHLEVIE